MRAGKNGLKLNIRSGAKLQWSLSSLKPPLVNICNVNNIVGLQKAGSGRIEAETDVLPLPQPVIRFAVHPITALQPRAVTAQITA